MSTGHSHNRGGTLQEAVGTNEIMVQFTQPLSLRVDKTKEDGDRFHESPATPIAHTADLWKGLIQGSSWGFDLDLLHQHHRP